MTSVEKNPFVPVQLGCFCVVASATIMLAMHVQADDARKTLRQQVASQIDTMRSVKRPSQSIGNLSSGQLLNPAELPKPSGVGYAISHPDRDTNFGADRLVYGLMQLGLTMRERLGDEPHHRVVINEISDRDGGKQERHINHQMGLDVDICLYATDKTGNPKKAQWVTFDAQGLSPNKSLKFDAERNWTLVDEILSNETFGEIRAIFISEPLKNQLLKHAMSLQEKAEGAEAKRLNKNIQLAIKLLRQPTSSPHDNHFHLSLTQSKTSP